MRRDPSLIPLSHQHHNGLALCVLTDRELAKDSSEENVSRLRRRVIDRFEVELVNHFAIEEEVLFPTLDSLPLTAQLVSEHRRLEELVAALKLGAAAATLTEFTTLLRTHIRLEENELFPQAQTSLSPEVLEQLGAEIERRAVRVCL